MTGIAAVGSIGLAAAKVTWANRMGAPESLNGLRRVEQDGWVREPVQAVVNDRPGKAGLAQWAELHLPPPASSDGARPPRPAFDLREIRGIVEGAAAAGPADMTFESMAIHHDAAHLCLRHQDMSRNYLVRVHGLVLDTEALAGRFLNEVRQARQAAAHYRVAGLLDVGRL
ncbi:hypothetical protein ACFWQ6_00595 [Streptomyces coelicoflavus]|uniref:hypothetical protein n=1 Tax=Streptomyces coelicoflavus TaxID=285562 RepID=UPI0036661039